MRRLRGDSRALSEIVGTLMLVLIVIGAAVAFAAFVAGYEKQLLTQEGVAHDRSLESLRILSVVTVNQTGPGKAEDLDALNFTIASETVNPALITNFSVNNIPVIRFGESNPSATCLPPATPLGNVTVAPFAEETFCLNAIPSGPTSAFASWYPPVNLTSDLQISLYTALGNEFTTSFLPPTAIATVSLIPVENSTNLSYIPALDSSKSFQTGTNATIVSWNWSVTPVGTSVWANKTACTGTQYFLGEVYELATPPCTFKLKNTYLIDLVVINSDGLRGIASMQYEY